MIWSFIMCVYVSATNGVQAISVLIYQTFRIYLLMVSDTFELISPHYSDGILTDLATLREITSFRGIVSGLCPVQPRISDR